MGEAPTMTSQTSAAGIQAARATPLRSWRTAVGLGAVAAGATITVGAFLPWVETFAGLIQIPGIRGGNGRMLAAAGIVIAVAGLYHVIRGAGPARWLIGIGGFGSLAFAGYLLIRLSSSLRSLGGDSMVLARGGPGLWVIAAGSLLAFTTLFMPPSSQTTLRRRDGSGIVAWAADLDSAGARRALQIGLGMVWLLDAGLQYQPYMFGKSFVTQVLDPSVMGNPALVANPVMVSGQLIGHHPAAWNAVFATIQLVLAGGLLWRRTVKAALAGTVVWALAVWWFGEGLGGVFTGTATPVTGAPGPAILYALTALLVWPAQSMAGQSVAGQAVAGQPVAGRPAKGPAANSEPASVQAVGTQPARWHPASVAAGSPLGDRGARLAWLVLWGSSAFLLLQAANRAPLSLHDTFAGLAAGEPGWLAAVDHAVAAAVGDQGTLVSILLATVFAAIAAGVFRVGTTRPALVTGIVIAMLIWLAGENVGGIFTGHGTDPNTGPLLILLAAAFWPLARRGHLPHSQASP